MGKIAEMKKTGNVIDTGSDEYDTSEIKFDQNCMAQVPFNDPLYVPFGNYKDIATITASGAFFPYWVYGLSGNGKTLSIEQSHAHLGKKLVLVPITREADEDSLLGGLRLVNGDTVPFFGPVTVAALTGCTVCLDEVDLGDAKMMCLQTALQNRPYLIKRLGKIIVPKPGFNICATANTKGQGSAGQGGSKFAGTNVMNEAMLDRYVTVFEQDYPSPDIEKTILLKFFEQCGLTTPKESQFVIRLLSWAAKIRKSFNDDAISEVITTRRLVHIARAYHMFGKDRKKAIERGVSRFNPEIQGAFMDFYKAIDDDANANERNIERVTKATANGTDPETGF